MWKRLTPDRTQTCCSLTLRWAVFEVNTSRNVCFQVLIDPRSELNRLTIMPIIIFGGKRVKPANQRSPSQRWSLGVARSCCGCYLLLWIWWFSNGIFVGRTKKACVTNEAYKLDLLTPVLSGEIVRSLQKVTQSIWPKLNNLKSMLPNTNKMNEKCWPTNNVMKEIQGEIIILTFIPTIILTLRILKIK